MVDAPWELGGEADHVRHALGIVSQDVIHLKLLTPKDVGYCNPAETKRKEFDQVYAVCCLLPVTLQMN